MTAPAWCTQCCARFMSMAFVSQTLVYGPGHHAHGDDPDVAQAAWRQVHPSRDGTQRFGLSGLPMEADTGPSGALRGRERPSKGPNQATPRVSDGMRVVPPPGWSGRVTRLVCQDESMQAGMMGRAAFARSRRIALQSNKFALVHGHGVRHQNGSHEEPWSGPGSISCAQIVAR